MPNKERAFHNPILQENSRIVIIARKNSQVLKLRAVRQKKLSCIIWIRWQFQYDTAISIDCYVGRQVAP